MRDLFLSHNFRATLALFALLFMASLSHAQDGLDYRQKQVWQIADGNLASVEGNLEAVAKQVAAASAKDAPQVQANIDALRKFHKQALDQIGKLPADNAAVKELSLRASEAATAIEKLQSELGARVSGTQGAVNAEMAQFDADVDKLIDWGKAFSDAPNLFQSRPDDAIMLAGNITHVEAEWAAIQSRNAALLDPGNHDEQAQKIQAAADFFRRSFPSFQQHAGHLRQDLPGRIDQNIASAQRWIDMAVADQNPLLIINGVSQDMQQAEVNARVLKAIDATAGAAAEKRVAEMRAKAAEAGKALRESIIQAAQAPQDQYAGSDVAELRELVTASWSNAHPNSQLLAVVFNTPGWNRVTRWEWSLDTTATGNIEGATWRKVDYDVIQPKAIVRFDDRLAVVYPVDVYKDHMQGDRVTIKPWDLAADPDVRSLLLLERVPKRP